MTGAQPGAGRHEAVRTEFTRAGAAADRRTGGRFDALHVPGFARLQDGEIVVEVGAGTGDLLSLLHARSGLAIAVDVAPSMPKQARAARPYLQCVVADGARLPLADRSVDLVATAQMLHRVSHPVPLLVEMRRVCRSEGRILIIDQAGPDRVEEAMAAHALEVLRDPTHAATRPPAAFRILCTAAGLDVVDQKIVEQRATLSAWMWPGEFPDERIEAVRRFMETHGKETGMGFAREEQDWSFTRRRIMILAKAAR